MALTLVLSVGFDSQLLATRNLVLQSAGYTVVRAFSLKAAADCFQTLDFDLVLLCQSIPTKEKDRLVSWIRVSGSRIPVVSISEELCQKDGFACVTVGSEPDALLSVIRKALSNSAIPEARTATYRDKQEAAVASRNKPPGSSDGCEEQTKTTEEHFAPVAHAG
jgi:DNA-binding response OmpR family regulator